MTDKDILIYIINTSNCKGIVCEVCPLYTAPKACGNPEGFIIKERALKIFLGLYGKTELMEVLL